jgi:secreted trypsin-like serine protease
VRAQEKIARGRPPLLFAAALSALTLLVPAAAQGAAHASIVGGHGATVGEFPSLAFIESHEGLSGFACTGTVVAPRVVLTAAHCVEDLERGGFTPAGSYAVTTGTTNPGKARRENVFHVTETHVFPGFDPGGLHGDAGILVLNRPTSASPIALAGAGDAALYEGGAPVQLAGWGLKRANAFDGAESLRAASMVVQAPAFCKRKTRRYYDTYSAAQQLCVLDAPGRKSGGCFGDSGGPAIGQRPDGTTVELGVISTGGPFCSTKLPNVLTRVDFISGWVAEWIAATETDAPPPAIDPKTPFPLMTRPVAEAFALFTLQAHLGPRFERAKQAFGSCRRASRTRFRCEVSWRLGPDIYAGVVTPFYDRRRQAVVWDSHFRIEWAVLSCLRSNPARCKIHVRRG